MTKLFSRNTRSPEILKKIVGELDDTTTLSGFKKTFSKTVDANMGKSSEILHSDENDTSSEGMDVETPGMRF